jgi:hypothetical protein
LGLLQVIIYHKASLYIFYFSYYLLFLAEVII